MNQSICHYSYHRTWKEKHWTCRQFAEQVKALGCEGIDFHAGLIGSTEGAAELIRDALARTGRKLSGLSLGNNFNQDNPEILQQQIDRVLGWMRVAAEVRAPVSRIFGGHVTDRTNPGEVRKGMQKILDALGRVVREAEKLGVVLALENHGGLPCTGEEQVEVIRAINSPHLRATVDVGNYLQGGQEGHEGTAVAAPYAAYVHFKDFQKKYPAAPGKAWDLKACTVGRGNVNHRQCLDLLKKSGYHGFIALEYEGPDPESTGVPESLHFMIQVMRGY